MRERVLGLLYEAESKGIDMDELLADLELPLDPYAHTVVTGTAYHQDEIDSRLEDLSEGWTVARMPRWIGPFCAWPALNSPTALTSRWR